MKAMLEKKDETSEGLDEVDWKKKVSEQGWVE